VPKHILEDVVGLDRIHLWALHITNDSVTYTSVTIAFPAQLLFEPCSNLPAGAARTDADSARPETTIRPNPMALDSRLFLGISYKRNDKSKLPII
jgi:hypothetical protein